VSYKGLTHVAPAGVDQSVQVCSQTLAQQAEGVPTPNLAVERTRCVKFIALHR
jgi:hypothetical protein